MGTKAVSWARCRPQRQTGAVVEQEQFPELVAHHNQTRAALSTQNGNNSRFLSSVHTTTPDRGRRHQQKVGIKAVFRARSALQCGSGAALSTQSGNQSGFPRSLCIITRVRGGVITGPCKKQQHPAPFCVSTRIGVALWTVKFVHRADIGDKMSAERGHSHHQGAGVDQLHGICAAAQKGRTHRGCDAGPCCITRDPTMACHGSCSPCLGSVPPCVVDSDWS